MTEKDTLLPSALHSKSGQIEIDRLTAQHIDIVFSLFNEVRCLVPIGHLNERSREDIFRAICDPSSSASVGAWKEGRLVAYSLCSKDTEGLHSRAGFVRLLRDRGDEIWTGKGTIVRPDLQGQLLMPRLLKARGSLIRSLGIVHSFGLIAVDNLASLAGAFRAGACVIDLIHDEYCQKFLCYAGELSNELTLHGNDYAAIDNLTKISSLVSQGWIATDMQRSADSKLHVLKFKQCPLATGSQRNSL